MIKVLAGAMVVLFIFALALTPPAHGALDQFGKIEVLGGVEKEPGTSGGGRGTVMGLGVLPLVGNFGLQGIVESRWGAGWRLGLGLGPVVDFGGGKAGFFVAYQYRAQGSNNLVFLNPSLALYFNQANMNFWYSHPVAGSNSYNRLQWTMSVFNASDWASFLRRDNVELTAGLQVNSFAGSGNFGTGVGPVLGVSFMPMAGVGVKLISATFDFNQSRYRVDSGVEVYFGRGTGTLKEVTRKYLQPNQTWPGGGAGGGGNHS